MDPLAWVCKQLEEAEPDLLRAMVSAFADALMGAEVDAVSNAAYNQRTSERANSRNGYRERPGTLGPARSMSASPSCARGSYFCDWLIEPRRRAEQALVQVVADFYLAGVSTRRVDKLVKTLGIEGISKSQVSELAKSLDSQVAGFRNRPLDQGPTPICSSRPSWSSAARTPHPEASAA